MKKWYMKGRMRKGEKYDPAAISKKWSKGTAPVNPQVWENSSHVHVKTAIILSLSRLNIRPTFV